MSHDSIRVNEAYMLLYYIRKLFDCLDYNAETTQLTLPIANPAIEYHSRMADYNNEALITVTGHVIETLMHCNLDAYERTKLITGTNRLGLKIVMREMHRKDVLFVKRAIQRMQLELVKAIKQVRETFDTLRGLLLPINHIKSAEIDQQVRDRVKVDALVIQQVVDNIRPWYAISVVFFQHIFETFEGGYDEFIHTYTNIVCSLSALLYYMYNMTSADSIDLPPPLLIVERSLISRYRSEREHSEIDDEETKVIVMMIEDITRLDMSPHIHMTDPNNIPSAYIRDDKGSIVYGGAYTYNFTNVIH